jgi:hypothetical protein
MRNYLMLKRNMMNLSRALVCAVSVVVLCVVSADAAPAQAPDRRTSVTFSVPVEIPGNGAQVLPAGTYVFRLLDSLSDRHIVQVLNAEETHVYATILAIPNSRLRPTDRTVITFEERPAGEPQAIKAWFYPGDLSGQEFVYPKQRAVELARIVNEPVLAIPNEAAPNIVAEVTTPTAPPVIALRTAPVTAVTPAGEEVALSAVVEAPPVQVAASLPKTASGLPLLALVGFLSVSMGLALKSLCAR